MGNDPDFTAPEKIVVLSEAYWTGLSGFVLSDAGFSLRMSLRMTHDKVESSE